MNIKGEDLKRWHQALLEAFPDKNSLSQMVRFGLDQNLEKIAGDGTLADIVFKLIEWAAGKDQMATLLEAARRANPTNQSLLTISKTPFSKPSLEGTIDRDHPPPRLRRRATLALILVAVGAAALTGLGISIAWRGGARPDSVDAAAAAEAPGALLAPVITLAAVAASARGAALPRIAVADGERAFRSHIDNARAYAASEQVNFAAQEYVTAANMIPAALRHRVDGASLVRGHNALGSERYKDAVAAFTEAFRGLDAGEE